MLYVMLANSCDSGAAAAMTSQAPLQGPGGGCMEMVPLIDVLLASSARSKRLIFFDVSRSCCMKGFSVSVS